MLSQQLACFLATLCSHPPYLDLVDAVEFDLVNGNLFVPTLPDPIGGGSMSLFRFPQPHPARTSFDSRHSFDFHNSVSFLYFFPF